MNTFFCLIVMWSFFGVTSAVIADTRGSGAGVGFLLGVLLGPIGLVVAAVLPVNPAALTERNIKEGRLRRCMRCREAIQHDALQCPHCGQAYMLAPQ